MAELSLAEGKILDLINQVREKPTSIVQQLEDMKKHFKKLEYCNPDLEFNVMTEEGEEAVENCIAFLNAAPAVPKLVRKPELDAAARKLADDIGKNGTGTSSDEKLAMEVRIKEAKKESGSMAENVSFGWKDPAQIVLQMLIDDGVKSRGHRKNFLSPTFTEVGIALSTHKIYNHCCVFDLFGKSQAQDKTFDKYEIDKSKWPENAVSLQKHLEMKVKDGKKTVKLTYEFKLQDGQITTISQDFNEDATD